MAPTRKWNDTWSRRRQKAAVQRTSQGLEGKSREGGKSEDPGRCLPRVLYDRIVRACPAASGRPVPRRRSECVMNSRIRMSEEMPIQGKHVGSSRRCQGTRPAFSLPSTLVPDGQVPSAIPPFTRPIVRGTRYVVPSVYATCQQACLLGGYLARTTAQGNTSTSHGFVQNPATNLTPNRVILDHQPAVCQGAHHNRSPRNSSRPASEPSPSDFMVTTAGI